MRLVSNYQKMLDQRLSKPKSLQKIAVNQANRGERVYKNSALREQMMHQSVFSEKKGKANGWADDA